MTYYKVKSLRKQKQTKLSINTYTKFFRLYCFPYVPVVNWYGKGWGSKSTKSLVERNNTELLGRSLH